VIIGNRKKISAEKVLFSATKTQRFTKVFRLFLKINIPVQSPERFDNFSKVVKSAVFSFQEIALIPVFL